MIHHDEMCLNILQNIISDFVTNGPFEQKCFIKSGSMSDTFMRILQMTNCVAHCSAGDKRPHNG